MDEILNLIKSVSEGFPSYFCGLSALCAALVNFSNRPIGIINFEKLLSKLYRRHYDLVSVFKV